MYTPVFIILYIEDPFKKTKFVPNIENRAEKNYFN